VKRLSVIRSMRSSEHSLAADEKIDALDRREWDFRPLLSDEPTFLQKQELRCAIFYEYARESPTVRSLVETLRGGIPSSLTQGMTGPSSWQPCVLSHPEFPRTPWLGLPTALRERLVERCDRRSTLFEILESERIDVSELSSASHKKYFGTVEKVAIAIDWSAGTNDDIIEAVASWVRNSRPASFPSPRADSSRENVAAAFLSRLAVARLLNHHPHTTALDYALEHGISMFKQQGKAANSRKLVRDDIRRIFGADYFKKTFGKELVPPDELPLCWELAKRPIRIKHITVVRSVP
jgi:hypothetical protein